MPKVIVKERRPERITVFKDGFRFVFSNSPSIFVKSDVSFVLSTVKNEMYGFLEISTKNANMSIFKLDDEVIFVLDLPKVNILSFSFTFTVSFKELVSEINEALNGKSWLGKAIDAIKSGEGFDDEFISTPPPLP